MSAHFAALQARVWSLQAELDAAKQALHDARNEEAGIRIGDIVRGTAGRRSGTEGIVTRTAHVGIRPWVYIRPRKKNGEFGERETCLYGDWERIP